MVQARLLYSIALQGRNEVKDAQYMLGQATQLAIEIGMNHRNFYDVQRGQQELEIESLRRTWWEVYIINGYVAAFCRKSDFDIRNPDADVLLPCEEIIYKDDGFVPEPFNLTQFDQRLFSHEELPFSSYCYRIEAVRILARVLALTGSQEVHHDEVQAVDNALSGWAHHLPPAKVDIVNAFGEVDELLFQAHMIIQCATIFLHFPRSNLMHTLAATADITFNHRDIQFSPTSTQNTHAVKATEASKQISNLAALRLPVQNHSPYFICALALSAVVQLSACSVHSGNCEEQHRDRVVLLIGVLKSLGRIWVSSQIVLEQIKKVAAEVFHVSCSKNGPSSQPLSQDSGIDVAAIMSDNAWLENLDIPALQNLMNFDSEGMYSG